jgi:hypothetical protein
MEKIRHLVRFPFKELRAFVIADYVNRSGYSGVVCFGCGNAAAELRRAGLTVVDVSAKGDLMANRWWRPWEIRKAWPHLFDATSGHLPLFMLVTIAKYLKARAFTILTLVMDEYRTANMHLGREFEAERDVEFLIPSGSGETVICFRLAFPQYNFIPVYDNREPGTLWEQEAPLNYAIEALFKDIVIHGTDSISKE